KTVPLGRFFAFTAQTITMKRLLSAFAVAALMSVGCSEKASAESQSDVSVNTEDENINKPTAFSADSLIVADSAVISPTLTLEYSQKLLVFNGVSKTVLDRLYSDVLFNVRI